MRNPHFFQNHCHFQYNISWCCIENDNNFERNEDRANGFLKWTHFSSLAKSSTRPERNKIWWGEELLLWEFFDNNNFGHLYLVKMGPIFVSSILLHFRKHQNLLQTWSLWAKKISDKHMYFEKYKVYIIKINPSQSKTYSISR